MKKNRSAFLSLALCALCALIAVPPAALAAHPPIAAVNNPIVNAAMMAAVRAPMASLQIFASGFYGGGSTTYSGTTGQIVVTGSVLSIPSPFDPPGNVAFPFTGGQGLTWRFGGAINGHSAYIYSDEGHNILINGGDGADTPSIQLFGPGAGSFTLNGTKGDWEAPDGRYNGGLTGAGITLDNKIHGVGAMVLSSSLAPVGFITSGSAKTAGSIVLNADGTTASTVTVISGVHCTVGDQSGNGVIGNPAFSVSSTTLTITNNATNKGHVITYLCL